MSRTADLRYQPQVKELKDVVCFPGPEDFSYLNSVEKEINMRILTNYTDEHERFTTTGGTKKSVDRSDIQPQVDPA